MKHIDRKTKALMCIEAITSDSDMEKMLIDAGVKGIIKNKDTLMLIRKLETIYKYAHVSRNPSCIKSHGGWIKNLEKEFKFFKKIGWF